MRIGTWNVNSIRSRVGRVVDWLVHEDVDVLAMQEIKCTQEQFPFEAFTQAGYDIVMHGLNQWNGVAFASRLPISDVTVGFPSAPGFGKAVKAKIDPAVAQAEQAAQNGHAVQAAAEAAAGVTQSDAAAPGVIDNLEARALGVTVNGVRLWSLYVPNGRTLADPHYAYKLDWLARLASDTSAWLKANPAEPLALMGDWNIAPLDTDVWPTWEFEGATHTSPPERAAFAAFEQLGLTDVVRPLVPEGYTYWDYKQLSFPRNHGMRIDFILGSAPFADRVTGAAIYRNQRKGDAPSDHVPVVVEVEADRSEDDDRPMIF
jgi:exodeoxyribonuclease III